MKIWNVKNRIQTETIETTSNTKETIIEKTMVSTSITQKIGGVRSQMSPPSDCWTVLMRIDYGKVLFFNSYFHPHFYVSLLVT